MPKWLVVARNEYRIHTSRIRKVRPYFPYFVMGLLAVYIVFIAPGFASLLMDDFLALVLSEAALAMIQIILFIIFIYFMIIPISNALREAQTGQLEIFLAAPVKPSDVLLGEFLGQMPFYVIFLTIVTGSFTAMLTPLGLDVFQIAVIIVIFVITSLSSFWIGTVTAAILRTRLGKTARGRDIGRALAMIIALPLIALIYAVQFGGFLEILADPGGGGIMRNALNLLPSSWGAEVFLSFASHPSNIAAVAFETCTRVGGLVVFFVAVLWLGGKAASRAYSLEPTTFIALRAKPEGVFYRTVRSLGGGRSFGALVVSVFKDYSRRLENLSNIIYVVGLLLVMVTFVAPQSGAMGATSVYMMAQFLLPILIVMVNGEITVRGKECLFIFRKAPSGEGRLIRAILVKGWMIAVPIAGVMTLILTLLSSQPTLFSLVINVAFMVLFVAAYTAFVLGLFLLNPAFSEKSVRLWLNVIISIFTSVGLFAASILSLIALGGLEESGGSMIYVLLLQTAFSWLAGVGVLSLGLRKLKRIE